jgi:CRISPR-associated protein Cas1
MGDIIQNTLYLLTPGSYVARDHLTLQVEVPVYPPDLPAKERRRETVLETRKISLPIHHLESVCIFGACTVSAPALSLCWEHGVAVNYLTENGYLQARLTGVADTSVLMRRAQFRAADSMDKSADIARQIIAGKIQNSRNSLLRAARENESDAERQRLQAATDALARHLRLLETTLHSDGEDRSRHPLDPIRGVEGTAADDYFSVFSLTLKQQREDFAFQGRSRRPPRDQINCLLSFLYALVRNDCLAALTAIGLDPFVGFLHTDRPNRPSLALDLMEEFRPWLADRLAITLINRQQIGAGDFQHREGGAVEFTDKGRKLVIQAYQERKKETFNHSLLGQQIRIGQVPFVQARILARHLRGDIPHYLPFIPK